MGLIACLRMWGLWSIVNIIQLCWMLQYEPTPHGLIKPTCMMLQHYVSQRTSPAWGQLQA